LGDLSLVVRILTCDAVDVGLKQYFHAVASPEGNLRRRDAAVELVGQADVAEAVDGASQCRFRKFSA
jgi:hypothetical protein